MALVTLKTIRVSDNPSSGNFNIIVGYRLGLERGKYLDLNLEELNELRDKLSKLLPVES